MTDAPVVIVPYDPDWPRQFERERSLLATVFDSDAVIEHVGSTSVPGLGAKPIIDIMVGLGELSQAESRIGRMSTIDYLYVPEYESELPERRYFVRPHERPRTRHVHCVARTSDFWRTHLLFRDYLRSHDDTAAAYYELKCELAERYRLLREAYTEAKTEFIRGVLVMVEGESLGRLR